MVTTSPSRIVLSDAEQSVGRLSCCRCRAWAQLRKLCRQEMPAGTWPQPILPGGAAGGGQRPPPAVRREALLDEGAGGSLKIQA